MAYERIEAGQTDETSHDQDKEEVSHGHKRLFLTQVALVHYIRSGELPHMRQDLFRLVNEGTLRLHK